MDPAKRASAPALDSTVTSVTITGLGEPEGLFVLADGTRLVIAEITLLFIAPSGWLSTVAGCDDKDEHVYSTGAFLDARGIHARFNERSLWHDSGQGRQRCDYRSPQSRTAHGVEGGRRQYACGQQNARAC